MENVYVHQKPLPLTFTSLIFVNRKKNNSCSRLNLTSVAYLWRRDQAELMDEMIECELYAILIKVASIGK